MTKSAEEQLAELEAKRDQINARMQEIRARQRKKEQKERTHRLIQVGAVMENALDLELNTEHLRELVGQIIRDYKVNLSDGSQASPADIVRHYLQTEGLLEKPAPAEQEQGGEVQEDAPVHDDGQRPSWEHAGGDAFGAY